MILLIADDANLVIHSGRQNAELQVELKRLKEMYEQLQERFTKYVHTIYCFNLYVESVQHLIRFRVAKERDEVYDNYLNQVLQLIIKFYANQIA